MYYAWLLVWRSHCTQDRPMVFFHIVCCMLYVLCVEDSFCKLMQTEPQERVEKWENRKTLEVELLCLPWKPRAVAAGKQVLGWKFRPHAEIFQQQRHLHSPPENDGFQNEPPELQRFYFQVPWKISGPQPVTCKFDPSWAAPSISSFCSGGPARSLPHRETDATSCVVVVVIFDCIRVVKRMVEMVDSTTQVTTQKKKRDDVMLSTVWSINWQAKVLTSCDIDPSPAFKLGFDNFCCIFQWGK